MCGVEGACRVSIGDFDDIGFESFEVEQRDGGAIGEPAAAFAWVEVEYVAAGWVFAFLVDDFVGVAADDYVRTGDVLGLEPVDPVMHDDGAVVELDTEGAVNHAGQNFFEALAFAIVVAVDAVERAGGGVGCVWADEEFSCKGRDEVSCVEHGTDSEAFEKR